jgi:hypothetical protein
LPPSLLVIFSIKITPEASMTNYDIRDWTPEEEAIAEENMRKYRILSKKVKPLIEKIETYIESAISGRCTKQKRDSLLASINQVLNLSKKLDCGHIELSSFNLPKLRIRILGAFEYSKRFMKSGKKNENKIFPEE